MDPSLNSRLTKLCGIIFREIFRESDMTRASAVVGKWCLKVILDSEVKGSDSYKKDDNFP